MPHFFISYAKKDTRELALALSDALNAVPNTTAWVDRSLKAGKSWELQIQSEIDKCDYFVVLYSPDINRHKRGEEESYVLTEIHYAKYQLKRPIIPVMAQTTEPPMSLTTLHYIDFTLTGLNLDNLVEAICDEAKKNPAREIFTSNEKINESNSNKKDSTEQIIQRFLEAKNSDLRFARELLDKIAERKDIPIFFDVVEEDSELKVSEAAFAQFHKTNNDYEGLVQYIQGLDVEVATKAINRFRHAYPDYGDPKHLIINALLPKPFAWCEIPAGTTELRNIWDDRGLTYLRNKGDSENFEVSAFLLAKYPVTNAQFAKFMEAGGYKNKHWWTEQGWMQKEQERWTEPRYWNDKSFNGTEQPVTGISWYESVAFCHWLSDITGEKIMLPTEQQWQRAAQGDDGRIYAYGNEWNQELCNNSVSPKVSRAASHVEAYEHKGNLSAYQVVDMTGNVNEWCLTEYETGHTRLTTTNMRCIRGGSWRNNNTLHFRVDFRSSSDAHYRYSSLGFRISCAL